MPRATPWIAPRDAWLSGCPLAIGSRRPPPCSEKYSESVKLLDDARRRHVNSIYGEQVEQLKVDLIRLFRLRSFDG